MLSGKVAIVTGASRGIGRETALTLAGYGATVIVNYCGSKDKAEAVVEEIIAAGGTAKAYQGDVSDFDVAKEMITSVKKEFGSIDILVNNAGITKDNLIMKMSEEEFDKVIEVNFAEVREVARPFGEDLFVRRRHVGVRAPDGADAAIEVIGNGELFRSATRAFRPRRGCTTRNRESVKKVLFYIRHNFQTPSCSFSHRRYIRTLRGSM